MRRFQCRSNPLRWTAIAVCATASISLSDAEGVVYRNASNEQASVQLGSMYPMVCAVSRDGCGTLIASKWVLTAAHVANGISPFEPVVRFGEREYPIRAIYVHHEGHSDGMRPPNVDLALLELAEPVQDIKPAALCHERDGVGAHIVIVGRGDVGVADERPRRSDGRLRAVRNTVERASDGRLVVRFDPEPSGVELEGVGAPGDSGGGLFLKTEDHSPVLAGVSSASMGGKPGSIGVQDVYARVSEFAPWIHETMANAPEGAAFMPNVFDLRDRPIPAETPATACLSNLLQALASPDDQLLLAFAAAYRSGDARHERSDDQWVQQMERVKRDVGVHTAKRLAIFDDRRALVEVINQRGQAVTIEVELDDQEKLMGIGIGMPGRNRP